MQVGSLVQVMSDFTYLKSVWKKLNFPTKDDLITVETIRKHPVHSNLVLLTFEEVDNNHGFCHIDCNGFENFKEVVPNIDFQKIQEENKSEIKHIFMIQSQTYCYKKNSN